MAGGIVITVVLVLLIPIAVSVLGAILAAVLGWALKDNAEQEHAGSELIDMNR
jgi:UPF0716 family protein affecting phage T7 exclusion